MTHLLMSTPLLLSLWTFSVKGESDAPHPVPFDAAKKNVPSSATALEENVAEQSMREVQESFDKEVRSKSHDWSSSSLLNERKNKTPRSDNHGKRESDTVADRAGITNDDATAGPAANHPVSNSKISIAMLFAGAIAGLIAVCAFAQSRLKRPRRPIGANRKLTV